MNCLEAAVDRAVLKGAQGAVMYINIDRFGKVKSQVGINNADMVLPEIWRNPGQMQSKGGQKRF